MSERRSRAHDAVLDEFRWTDGHADFAHVLRSPTLMSSIGHALAEPFGDAGVSSVIAIEARGFVFGALAAEALGVGLVLARKPGSIHPDTATEVAMVPDYRGNRVELRVSRRAVRPGDRLLLVDDWIETGAQAWTVANLVARLGGALVGVSCVIDDATDETRTELKVSGLVRSAELPAQTIG